GPAPRCRRRRRRGRESWRAGPRHSRFRACLPIPYVVSFFRWIKMLRNRDATEFGSGNGNDSHRVIDDWLMREKPILKPLRARNALAVFYAGARVSANGLQLPAVAR